METTNFATDNNFGHKTPEEIKKGLEFCSSFDSDMCLLCPYDDGHVACCLDKNQDALAYIKQLEANRYRDRFEVLDDLSCAYYGKKMYGLNDDHTVYSRYSCENMSFEAAVSEFARLIVEEEEGIERLASQLTQVERERDALLDDLRHSFDPCTVCKKQDICEQYCPDNDYNCPDCKDKHRCICHNCTADNDLWEWRGVCEENTKDDSGAHSQ